MLRIDAKITIGNFNIPFFSELSINSRNDLLLDIASIAFPNVVDKKGKKIGDFVKVGDKVNIELGYNSNLKKRFSGFVNKIIPDRTCIIECLCEGYPYKFLTVKDGVFLKNTTFAKLFKKISPEIPLNITDANIGDWKIERGVSVFSVIQELKDKFGILPYFRGGKLTFLKSDVSGKILIDFQKNVCLGQDDLKLKVYIQDNKFVRGQSQVKGDDGKLQIINIYIDNSGTKTVQPAGVQVGSISIPGIAKSDLENLCKKKLAQVTAEGLSGEVVTFGEPIIEHGYTAKIKDITRPDIEGEYLIKSVLTTVSEGGFRQKIGISEKIL